MNAQFVELKAKSLKFINELNNRTDANENVENNKIEYKMFILYLINYNILYFNYNAKKYLYRQ